MWEEVRLSKPTTRSWEHGTVGLLRKPLLSQDRLLGEDGWVSMGNPMRKPLADSAMPAFSTPAELPIRLTELLSLEACRGVGGVLGMWVIAARDMETVRHDGSGL
jgi:hypothetical protein